MITMFNKGEAMKYRLIAADMDGTLLNDESQMSERTKAAIRKAVESGALFVTATGRAMSGVESVNALLDKDMPFIVMNGASVVMGKSRKVLFNKYLDLALVKEIYKYAAEYDVPMVVRTNERLWVSSESNETDKYSTAYSLNLEKISDIDGFDEKNIFKAIWFGTPEMIARCQREMNEVFKGRLNCHSSLPMYLEFVSFDSDKGIAMAEVGRIYGIDRSEMIAVGDGYNDISMLRYAGLGIAMANAPDDVKNACKQVTLSNNDDGVAAVIEEYIL